MRKGEGESRLRADGGAGVRLGWGQGILRPEEQLKVRPEEGLGEGCVLSLRFRDVHSQRLLAIPITPTSKCV